MQLAKAAMPERLAKRRGVRQAVFPAGIAPETGYGAERDVEAASGVRGQLLGAFEDANEIGAWLSRQTIQFAIRAIVGENGVELRDAVECGAECGFGLR